MIRPLFALFLLVSSVQSAPVAMTVSDAVAVDSKQRLSQWKPRWTELNAWAVRVRRPGYQLLHKSSAQGYHFAVFADGTQAVALAVHRWREKEVGETAQEGVLGKGLKINWDDARDLIRIYELSSNGSTNQGGIGGGVRSEAKFEEKEGAWIPIPSSYKGPIQVIYDVTRRGKTDRILEATFRWPE